jgi:hypothetical protein
MHYPRPGLAVWWPRGICRGQPRKGLQPGFAVAAGAGLSDLRLPDSGSVWVWLLCGLTLLSESAAAACWVSNNRLLSHLIDPSEESRDGNRWYSVRLHIRFHVTSFNYNLLQFTVQVLCNFTLNDWERYPIPTFFVFQNYNLMFTYRVILYDVEFTMFANLTMW